MQGLFLRMSACKIFPRIFGSLGKFVSKFDVKSRGVLEFERLLKRAQCVQCSVSTGVLDGISEHAQGIIIKIFSYFVFRILQMYKRQKLILRNLETQKLDEFCLVLTGVALAATIFLAPHHNKYTLPNNDVDSVMLKVYRE